VINQNNVINQFYTQSQHFLQWTETNDVKPLYDIYPPFCDF